MCTDYIGSTQNCTRDGQVVYLGQMRGSVVKVCPQCNGNYSVFYSRRNKRKYCSHACYVLAETVGKRKLCECQNCGKEWQHLISQKGDKFCSYDCWNVAKRTRIEKLCPCGKPFITHPHREKDNRGKFCSSKCYWESIKIDPEVYRQNRNAYTRKYRRERAGWAAECKQRRRAREVGAPGHFTAMEWLEIQDKQKGLCALCGEKKKLTVDHIVPLARGGSNYASNIQGLCINCNSKKWVKI